ncbi:MAG: preprotein translocase subunit YajC [Planctomycetota bacterium JB042]
MDAILLLLQAEGGAPAPEAPPTWPLLVGFILIFYFLMFRPQIKEQKRRREMLSTLKKNDKVVTNGGMHGTIVSLGEDTVVLKVDDNVRIKFSRAAIAGPAPGQELTEEKGA